MKHFLIIVAVLALVVPGALLAQSGIPRERLAGITLENLAGALANLTERVEALEDTQALDAIEQRIQVLEEALAEMEVSSAQPEGEACLIIVGGGDFIPLGNQLRPETLDEYLGAVWRDPWRFCCEGCSFLPRVRHSGSTVQSASARHFLHRDN